jgi:hypothetical protein
MRSRHAVTASILSALVAGLILLLVVPGQAAAAKPCWKRVIDDWLASPNGTVTGTYQASCLVRALKYGEATEDLRDYTNIVDAIDAALQDALAGKTGSDPPNGRRPQGGGPEPPINKLGRTGVDSVPVPLLVLAGLGSLLLLTAGGLAAVKWRKAALPRRRGTPPTGTS